MGKVSKPPPKGVAVGVQASDNRKTGKVNVTYVSHGSCSVTCPHLGHGCYAHYGHVGIVSRRLNEHGCGLTPEEYARSEAAQIDKMHPDRPLRPHVVGDCRTNGAARILAAAAKRYRMLSRFWLEDAAPVWTYTHSWALVDRTSWGEVSVLASCERFDQVLAAAARGYACALIVDRFDDERAYELSDGFKLVPCPHETKGTQCVDCGLCFDDERLRDAKLVIGFTPHGSGASSVRRSLEVL